MKTLRVRYNKLGSVDFVKDHIYTVESVSRHHYKVISGKPLGKTIAVCNADVVEILDPDGGKHIRIEVDWGGLTAEITSQTHIGQAFGKNDARNSYVSSNGMVLESAAHPQYSTELQVFVWGSERNKNNLSIHFKSNGALARFVDAVREYNAEFDVVMLPKELFIIEE